MSKTKKHEIAGLSIPPRVKIVKNYTPKIPTPHLFIQFYPTSERRIAYADTTKTGKCFEIREKITQN